MGYKIPKSQYVHETLAHLVKRLDQTKWEQLVLGLSWWFMLWLSRRLSTKPATKPYFGWLKPTAPLITCALAIVIGANMKMFNGCGFEKCHDDDHPDAQTKHIVGAIPSGLESMGSVGKLHLSKLQTVVSAAVSCSVIGVMGSTAAPSYHPLHPTPSHHPLHLTPSHHPLHLTPSHHPLQVIGFMESIAIAKSLAAKHKYEVDPGQELIALGVANVLGSLTSAYPVTGSFSRSAVNNQVGAQSQLAGLLTGLLLLLTLWLLTPLFYFLPKYALAAIVIASVTNLVDYNEAIHLWRVKKQDCLLWVVAFLGTLFLGVQLGLLVSVGLSSSTQRTDHPLIAS